METRLAQNIIGTYTNPSSTAVGDRIGDLIVAWHKVAKSFAIDRCALNHRNGKPLRSIVNTDRFKGDNIKYVHGLLRAANGPHVPDEELFGIYFVNTVIWRMFEDACKQERGRWQWRGFVLAEEEMRTASFSVLRAWIAGTEHE